MTKVQSIADDLRADASEWDQASPEISLGTSALEREAADEIERLEKALAAADVVCHTLYHGDGEHGAVLDAYWAARGGYDACTVCSVHEPGTGQT